MDSWAADVRSWRHITPAVRDHATFHLGALEAGQDSYKALIGWALTAHNAATGRAPSKHAAGRRGTFRLNHGRVSNRKVRRLR